jgi:hypothetical protein
MTFEEMQEMFERMSQRHEQFQRDIAGLLAVQRELQESDLRAREERADMDRRIAALIRIVEHLVGNAEVVDRIQADHEDRIRQLEQE